MIEAYPSPIHRSVALVNQASMLFILLYFHPGFLINENAKMREIVDKHFYDNWVLTVYMGFIVDLSNQWIPYKAAKLALKNTLTPGNIKYLVSESYKKLKKYLVQAHEYLQEGVLS